MNASNLEPMPVVPSARQLAWHRMERYGFIHFGPNTFSGNEWGSGREDPNTFNPTELDCRQWARVFKETGFTGIIITAKHHDGFCLWPSKYSTHTVAQSGWKGGKGDVLKELSEACQEYGLKMGIYISPWDRNHPAYGTPKYNDIFVKKLEELLTSYGPIFEVWFDGANGEGPNGRRQIYDFPRYIETIRRLQPQAVIFSDAGPDVRWVGNEQGFADETNWATLFRDRYVPGTPLHRELTQGQEDGPHWVPAEVNVSIRPGWFYHSEEDSRVRTPQDLMALYESSVGRNGTWLLNVPPDRRGLLHENDVKALYGFSDLFERTYGKPIAEPKPDKSRLASAFDSSPDTYWFPQEGEAAVLTMALAKTARFDRIVLEEPIALGQRVQAFRVEVRNAGKWSLAGSGTTIGYRRILTIPLAEADAVRVVIERSKATPAISRLSVHASNDAQDPMAETKAERDERMKWWREARFGLFVHWGLYSIPGGTWNGRVYGGASEWLIHSAQIPISQWTPLQRQFNPVEFDADEWVRLVKDAGMKYIVITSKHHEGFAMWPSQQGDWHIGNTPFGRDPLKELAEACKKHGIRLCFYYSILDWHHPDYLPRETYNDPSPAGASFPRYVSHMRAQLRELLTEYGPIGVLWFDGEWNDTWTAELGEDLYRYVRSFQPAIIINNRVSKGREGMAGMTQGDHVGDFGTPEQEIPAGGVPGVDWESCMTMNNSWGFHRSDHDWKSVQTLVRNLIDCASKGGNYLLNVGPDELGRIPTPSVERLTAIGSWLKVNGEAIYGTQAGPFLRPASWGRVTRKGDLLYLHIFDSQAAEIPLYGLVGTATSAYPLADPERKLKITPRADGLFVENPRTDDETPATVVVLRMKSGFQVVPTLARPDEKGILNLPAIDAIVEGNAARFEADKECIGFWTQKGDVVRWDFDIDQPGTYKVSIEFACEPESAGATYSLETQGGNLSGKVTSTGSWDRFETIELGSVTLVGRGPQSLRIRPLELPGAAVMNVRRVTLRRQP